MRYLGGKSRIAKPILEVILANATERTGVYWEPFIGGGGMASKAAKHFNRCIYSDQDEDLMLMWEALATGWEPPEQVSEEEYKALRHAEPSALRGFVGYGCSFGGKWFGGYARSKKISGDPRGHCGESQRSVLKGIKDMTSPAGGFEFHCAPYHACQPQPGDVVYCDPPYAGTTKYRGKPFNHEEFWRTARAWAEQGVHVFVSEYNAPEEWECVWEKSQHVFVAGAMNGNEYKKNVERLFMFRSV